VTTTPRETVLLVTAGGVRCALQISSLVETMRPLPLRAFAGAPSFVPGVSVIRGEALPVVNLAGLLGGTSSDPSRLVVVRTGQRKVALAVDRVIGIHDMEPGRVAAVPPLLSCVASEAIASLGSLDSDLLAMLRTSHVVPEDVWALLGGRDSR